MSIFLSYSRRDSELANRLYQDLQARGLQVWMDRDAIQAGTLWRTSIVDGIRNCRVFLLVVSTASQQSSNVAKEVSLAESNGKPILPLKIDDAPISPDFSYSLAGIQFVDMSLKGYENSLLELANAVQGLFQDFAGQPESLNQDIRPHDNSDHMDSDAAEAAHLAKPPSQHLDGGSQASPVKFTDQYLAGLEQTLAEELGPIVQVLGSREFALDLIKQPTEIVAKLQALGVPLDAAVHLRQRLEPFLQSS